jgi:hypothetical protein
MPEPAADQVLEIAGLALAHGSATRTDLLAAAVTARAPTRVMELLLDLPERCFHNHDEILDEISIRNPEGRPGVTR